MVEIVQLDDTLICKFIETMRLLQFNIPSILNIDCDILFWSYYFQVVLVEKSPPANAGDRKLGFNPWARKIPWRRKWQRTPVFLPGESHRQNSLEGYGLWGHKELDMIKGI